MRTLISILWPLGLIVLALIVSLAPIPGHMFLLAEAMNVAHIFFFGLFSIVVLYIVRNSGWMRVGRRVGVIAARILRAARRLAIWIHQRIDSSYLSAALIAAAFALLIEVLQSFTSRDADVMDLVRDGVGIFGFLSVYAVFDKRAAGFWRRLPRYSKAAAVLVATVALSAALLPFYRWVDAYRHRDEMFPVLLDFETRSQALFLGTSNAHFSIVPTPLMWSQNGSRSVGRVRLHGGEYPGLMVDQPVPDWRAYDSLRVTLFLDHATPQRFGIRINDLAHDQSYADRFNREFDVNPGVNDIDVPLDDVRAAPGGRQMDMTRINKIVVFALLPKEPVIFYLDDLRLE